LAGAAAAASGAEAGALVIAIRDDKGKQANGREQALPAVATGEFSVVMRLRGLPTCASTLDAEAGEEGAAGPGQSVGCGPVWFSD